MTAFVNKLFSKKTFETDFALVQNVDGLSGKHITMPDGIR
jgi:dynein heavy chain 1